MRAMRAPSRRLFAAVRPATLTLLAVALLAAACNQSPEARVADLRGKYEVTQFSFLPQDEPVAVPQVVDPGEASDSEALPEPEPADMVTADVLATADDPADVDAVAADGVTPPTASADTGRDVLFDVILLFRGRNTLPGLTLDVTHADAGENEKAIYRHYVDTTGMVKGDSKQVAFTLEDLPFEDGDVFSVGVRQTVPEAERAEYREFAEAGS